MERKHKIIPKPEDCPDAQKGCMEKDPNDRVTRICARVSNCVYFRKVKEALSLMSMFIEPED